MQHPNPYKPILEELASIFRRNDEHPSFLAEIVSEGHVVSLPAKKSVLFTGLNPSYAEGGPEGNVIFSADNIPAAYRNHFKHIANLADAAGYGDDWSYTDLFFFRGRGYHLAQKIISDGSFHSFLARQLKISMNIIESIRPKLIVACHAGARPYFGAGNDDRESDLQPCMGYRLVFNEAHTVCFPRSSFPQPCMGYRLVFNEGFGLHVISGLGGHKLKKAAAETVLAGTPVLFASSPAGLDKSEKERLVWMIRRVLAQHTVFFGRENYGSGGSAQLPSQLRALHEKLALTVQRKQAMIGRQQYEEAAGERERELAYLGEIIGIISMIV